MPYQPGIRDYSVLVIFSRFRYEPGRENFLTTYPVRQIPRYLWDSSSGEASWKYLASSLKMPVQSDYWRIGIAALEHIKPTPEPHRHCSLLDIHGIKPGSDCHCMQVLISSKSDRQCMTEAAFYVIDQVIFPFRLTIKAGYQRPKFEIVVEMARIIQSLWADGRIIDLLERKPRLRMT